jgi:hypothetical protein
MLFTPCVNALEQDSGGCIKPDDYIEDASPLFEHFHPPLDEFWPFGVGTMAIPQAS